VANRFGRPAVSAASGSGNRDDMWGSWSFASFVGLALGVALLIALSFLASPLLALLIFVVIGVPAVAVLAMRERSEGGSAREGGAPTTPEGRAQTPTGPASGAPASGEG
jgi:hypothetical protein